jgi:hypothetical protein
MNRSISALDSGGLIWEYRPMSLVAVSSREPSLTPPMSASAHPGAFRRWRPLPTPEPPAFSGVYGPLRARSISQSGIGASGVANGSPFQT